MASQHDRALRLQQSPHPRYHPCGGFHFDGVSSCFDCVWNGMVHCASYPAAGLSANGEVRVPILSEARGIRLPSDHPIKWPSILEALATRV